MRLEHVDNLIIGQGLAGSLLAWELIRRKRRVLVVDPPPGPADPGASRVAGGIVSPLTGRRFTKPAELESLIGSAVDLYGEIEEAFRLIVYQECPIWRLLGDDLEWAKLNKRREDPAYEPYIGEVQAAGAMGHGLADPKGSVCLHGARLDLARLLDRLRQFFQDTARLMEEPLDHNALELREGMVHYRHIRARQVTFCEGFRVLGNPWFHWAPVRPSKGEILTIGIRRELPEGIINAGKWLIPLGEGRYRLGATYERDNRDPGPTEAGRRTLLEAFSRLFLDPPEVTVLDHQAGVRPGKTDHYPVLGRHPDHPQLAIFNGLGSRGSLLAPHYARLLADHLEKGTPLPQAADARYWHDKGNAVNS
ncbi:glycine/D-amino acid oxidase-like deaminating enzyme [Natronospira proteinivora]|uniref:Glycine/D-amino acid oxidase-like deaminating enzyme n=1 Tax=Natronospira proteinivora TaxID=1807133 RepID=A0ABT1GCN8_9GAMM|nr:FAD-binding oxidoreductase [Natronospira proteinivora]MCP1727702.1 glycine/D-amino acid oxidase-like deaminating enzyme [Natronospira proteinivora]